MPICGIETICGYDVDNVFPYTVPKMVNIRDARLGVLNYIFMFLIVVRPQTRAAVHLQPSLAQILSITAEWSDGRLCRSTSEYTSWPSCTSSAATALSIRVTLSCPQVFAAAARRWHRPHVAARTTQELALRSLLPHLRHRSGHH